MLLRSGGLNVSGCRNTTGPRNCFSFDPIQSGGNVGDDASCGTGATDKPNVDPLLGTLAVRGTTPVYDLLSGSPAIDAATGNCPPADQRGVARPQGAACDSGPYEVEALPAQPLPPADTELAMRVGKGKLRMDGKGRIRVKLTCPATEANPPCRGKVVVGTLRKYWPLEACDCVRSMMRQSAGRRFSIAAGKTQIVIARLPRNLAAYIPDRWKPRKVQLVVQAEDAAGNRQLIRQKRKLVPAKRG